MKVKLSGLGTPKTNARRARTSEPGTLLGARFMACFRCGDYYPEEELSTFPKHDPTHGKVFVCRQCTQEN